MAESMANPMAAGPMASQTQGVRQGNRRLKRRIGRYLDAYWMVAPALALYALMVLYPVGREIGIAFHEWSVFSDMEWVGLENFREAFSDEVFVGALKTNVLYAAVVTVAKNVLGLAIAVLLAGVPGRVQGFFRVSIFLPVTLSYVAVGMLWSWIFNPTFGLLNQLLRLAGLPESAGWLGNPALALWAIMIVEIWKWTGFHMVLFVAGLQGIPAELYESARIDGANGWQQFRHISLPGLMPVIEVSVLLALTGAFVRNFDLVYVMTGGGPAHATEIVLTRIYTEAFQFLNFGYAAAQGVVLFLIALALSVAYLRALRRAPAA